MASISWIRTHRQKFAFLVVGGVNTVVGISIFPALFYLTRPWDVHYVPLLVVSQIAGITFSFITNKLIVFKTRGWSFAEYLRFATYYGIYFAVNLVLLPLCVEVFHQDPVIAQIFISIGSVVATYYWHSKISFRAAQR